ncbi:MAG TPA: DHH family phosphoesterase [Verrucomicrobiae bacterium]|nr:DHH family phosphoesterase [Verrucomicrobiae bacterium]
MAPEIKKEQGGVFYARRLLRFLARHKERLSPLLILTHDYPDPDALAGAFAFQYLALKVYGIESRIGYGGAIGRTENRAMVKILKIPVHRISPAQIKGFKHVALIDTQPRFGNNMFPANRRADIVIDQHPSETKPNADLAVIDPDCGATCVLLAQALLLKAIEIPERVATAIAYGIISDTFDLYRAQRPDVVQTYLSILHRCDMKALARIQNPLRSRRFFITLHKGIRAAVAYRRLIVSHLGDVSSPDQVSEIADFLLTYERIYWVFCTGRHKGNLHLSLRTNRPNAAAGEVLRDIVSNRNQAGGHGSIAGGRCKIGLNAPEEVWGQTEQELHQRLVKRLRIRSTGEFRKLFASPAVAAHESE